MDIRQVKLSEIKPYWRNPRKNEAGVAAVKKSIEEFGFNVPIVIDAENVIICGHTRYRALLGLGVEEVPCVISDLSPEKAKEFRIVDNASAEIADWATEKLIGELRDVGDSVDMRALGFDEVDRILQMDSQMPSPMDYGDLGTPESHIGHSVDLEDWENDSSEGTSEPGESGAEGVVVSGGLEPDEDQPEPRMGVSVLCPDCMSEIFIILER